ncbi:hypothetical protein [Mycobacterium sp. HNNTM2301]|uniref:hypothetical protein n=1 Tax=Mycobacterium hainanense TaxID=3289775 RepID=UPI0035A6C7B2
MVGAVYGSAHFRVFAQEPVEGLGAEVVGEDLDRHHAVQVGPVAAVEHPESAAPDLLDFRGGLGDQILLGRRCIYVGHRRSLSSRVRPVRLALVATPYRGMTCGR